MHDTPEPPSRSSPEFHESKIRDRCLATDCCQITEMAVLEWRRRETRGNFGFEHAGDVGARLFCGGRKPRYRLSPPRSA